jgi:hypothetical protein
MEIAFAEERVVALKETLTWEEVKERAWDKKTAVFGTGLGKLFARAKPDDVRIPDQEKRWEPFWHVRCSSLYEYDRTRHYKVPVPQPEVRTVVIDEREYIPSGEPRIFTMVGLERCREEATAERIVDAVTGEPVDYAHYLEFEDEPIADLAEWKPADSVVVPTQVRASSVVREVLSSLIKPLDADTIHQDLITIERIDLYYRPVYAFEFHWSTKDRTTVAEFDGLTGKLITEGASIREAVGKVLTPDVLFDVGVDAIDLLVPGGGIAIKLAKAAAGTRK